MRTFLLRLLACIAIVPPASALSSENGRIVLTAEQSTGGRLLAARSGEPVGVTLDKSCEANFAKPADARIEWSLPGPLPAGWWRGVAESNFTGGYANRGIHIVLAGGQDPSVRVDANYRRVPRGEPQRFEFWIYTSSPVQSVQVRPQGDLWRYNYTWPISRITLERATPGSLTAADAIALDLPVAADGAVALPMTLPSGNWSLAGFARKEGEIVVESAKGRSIRLACDLGRWKRPQTFTAFFHLGAPLAKAVIPTKGLFDSVVLRHLSAQDEPPIGIEGELAVTVDPARTVSGRLELLGPGLAGEAPAFPLLPHGKKTVVLTSWDDGKQEDLRCAEILVKHGYRPTFMLNGNSPALKFMDQLEALGAEIGSHAYDHVSLATQSPGRALENCVSMRLLLETQLRHPVISFAFPNGYFPAQNEDGDYVLNAVRGAGHWIGRMHLTREQTVEDIDEPLTMHSIGLYGSGNKALVAAWPRTLEKEGGVFYLKGHSWQIGKTGEHWQKFEEFIAQFARHPQAWYAGNDEFALWLWARKNIRLTVESRDARGIVVKLERPWLHPWLAARCPLSLTVPAGVTQVRWQGREVPVENGRVDLTWPE